MAGRRPKPTQLKLLEGNPGKRALNRNEPKPTGKPTCPAHLDKRAKAEWTRISKELYAIGLLTAVDRAALAAYCQCWSRWVEAEEKIRETSLVVASKKSGYPIQNPYVGIANTALDQMRKFLVEFGLTPASRTRLSIDGDKSGSDPFAEFMKTIGADDNITTEASSDEA
jgi:P27 family predicted phage terminase small subunit